MLAVIVVLVGLPIVFIKRSDPIQGGHARIDGRAQGRQGNEVKDKLNKHPRTQVARIARPWRPTSRACSHRPSPRAVPPAAQ